MAYACFDFGLMNAPEDLTGFDTKYPAALIRRTITTSTTCNQALSNGTPFISRPQNAAMTAAVK